MTITISIPVMRPITIISRPKPYPSYPKHDP